MGLAKRIIPTVLSSDKRLVKGREFKGNRVVGAAMQASCIYARREVDELILLDIKATDEKREPDYEWVGSITQQCFIPVTYGGGIGSVDHVVKLLHSGVDKISLCTAAIKNHRLVADIAREVGSQAIVVSIDAHSDKVTSHCGKVVHDITPDTWACLLQDLGAGEILLNNVQLDGKMVGYDLQLIERVARAVDIPVIASGGCGSYQHMHEALEAGADAVAAGAMFTFKDCTPRGAANYLKEKGWEVRI